MIIDLHSHTNVSDGTLTPQALADFMGERKVEVFCGGSCGSENLITSIRAAACPSCEVRVLDVTAAEGAERANQLGVQSVPAVAINDELVCCPCECGPDLAKLRAAGLGVPLS